MRNGNIVSTKKACEKWHLLTADGHLGLICKHFQFSSWVLNIQLCPHRISVDFVFENANEK
jgi:hypothetical protein